MKVKKSWGMKCTLGGICAKPWTVFCTQGYTQEHCFMFCGRIRQDTEMLIIPFLIWTGISCWGTTLKVWYSPKVLVLRSLAMSEFVWWLLLSNADLWSPGFLLLCFWESEVWMQVLIHVRVRFMTLCGLIWINHINWSSVGSLEAILK